MKSESVGASCGQDCASREEGIRNEAVKNGSLAAEGTNEERTEDAIGDLKMIGDWYRDELEVTKKSSSANKSLNKLVDTKKEVELSETLLLLATTNDIDSLTLAEGREKAVAATPSVTTVATSSRSAPNRTNDANHLLLDSTNQEIVSFHSSPPGESGGDGGGWTVTFEQILASVLADQQLAKFFEIETNLLSKMEKFQSRKNTESYSSFQNFGTTPS